MADNKDENAMRPTADAGWTQRADGRTFDDIRVLVQAAIAECVGPDYDGSDHSIWVCDLTDEWAVYQVDYSGDYLQVTYELDDTGKVTLGEPQCVSRVTQYEPMARKTAGDEAPSGLGLRSALRNVREVRSVRDMTASHRADFELREVANGTGGTDLVFTGYASVTESPYQRSDMLGEYTETIGRGAFKRSINGGDDVAFLVNHEGMSLARTRSGTLKLSEDDTGLHTEARLDLANPSVAALRSAVDRGDLDEMSFAFRVRNQEWSKDFSERRITDINLHQGDVSIVNYGSNPATGGTVSLRGVPLEAIGSLMREIRSGAAISSAGQATLKHVLSLASTADTAVDELQIVLSEYLGVPNPDDAQDAGDGAGGDDDDPSMSTGGSRSADALTVARNRLALARIA